MGVRLPVAWSAVLVLALLVWAPRAAVAREYAAIFNFGDSLVDAGNLVVDGIPDYLATARLPYGMTHFGYPTGRCSDGRLVVDFIAQELGVPLLPPSKARNATFHRGANFAITGATSLDTPFFVERGLGKTVWNSGSLHTQIQWFQDMKPKLCRQEQECRDLFRRSLFIVGEFGGNDYNSPLFAFRPLAEAHGMVPHVVESIGRGVERLIAEGAAELVVPGVLPIGCFPVYLSIFRRQPAGGYGARSGCIKELNTLSWVHNAALRRKVEELRARHPGVRIVYADYYTPAIQFVLHAEKYGQGRMEHVILCLQISLLLSSFSYSMQAQYTSIFSFGDSYTDTGNKVILYGPAAADLWINKPPFGMTFFGHPTGRLSDGRLVIDFIAQALGLPLLPPSLAKDQSFKQGANFAVAGATALKTSTSPALYPQLAVAGGAKPPPNNISLADELGWFDAMKPTLCGSPQACKDYFAKALFVVGELGWNDYGVMVVGGKSVAEAQSYVPQIVATIVDATEKLINDGATAIVVSGISPMGCAPGNLVLLASQDPADYEPDTGCLKGLNQLSRAHNAQLSQALATLGGRHPGARVTYADLYAPVIAFAGAPARFGFDSALRDCCGGGGGKYNFNLSAACGMPGVAACPNPSAYVNWDGVHLTEAAYHRVADGWLRGPYANPPILATA